MPGEFSDFSVERGNLTELDYLLKKKRELNSRRLKARNYGADTSKKVREHFMPIHCFSHQKIVWEF